MKIRLFVAAAVFAVLAASLGVSLAQAAGSPEDVVQTYFQYIQKGDWEETATLMDPKALADLRDMFAPIFQSPFGDEFAEEMFGPGMTGEQVLNLTDMAFYVKVMEVFAELVVPFVEFGETQIIGSVPEGPDTAHVVVRSTVSASGVTITQMEVISVRLGPDGWGILPSGEIEGLAEILRAELGLD